MDAWDHHVASYCTAGFANGYRAVGVAFVFIRHFERYELGVGWDIGVVQPLDGVVLSKLLSSASCARAHSVASG